MSEEIKKPTEGVEAKNEELAAEEMEKVSGGAFTHNVDKASPLLYQKCATASK